MALQQPIKSIKSLGVEHPGLPGWKYREYNPRFQKRTPVGRSGGRSADSRGEAGVKRGETWSGCDAAGKCRPCSL